MKEKKLFALVEKKLFLFHQRSKIQSNDQFDLESSLPDGNLIINF